MDFFRASKKRGFDGPHQDQSIAHTGANLDEAEFAMIMIHGRGASAESILTLTNELDHKNKIAFLAPQASGYTWYPYSFLAPTKNNQPGLNSGLQVIFDLIDRALSHGIPEQNIFLLGFSQGACLASEFIARHPAKYAGLIVLSGGLIGDKIDPDSYAGNLSETPVFMGCSDIDPHIPVTRVHESEAVFNKLGAKATKKIYPGMGHLVNEDEIVHIQKILNSKLSIGN